MSMQGPTNRRILRFKGYNTVCDGVDNDLTFLKDLYHLNLQIRSKKSPVDFAKKRKDLNENKCEDVARYAMLHRDACIPNSFDLMEFKNELKDKAVFQQMLKQNKCPCGCLQVKGQHLPFCLPQDQLQFLGSNTILFFFFTRLVIILCSIILILYGVYAVFNSITGKSTFEHCDLDIYCMIKTQTSIESKIDKPDIIIKEMWLGLGITIILCIALRLAKIKAIVIDELIDNSVETPSDYAIKLENMPREDYCEEEVIDWIRQLVLNLEMGINEDREPIQCKEVHIVYNMEGIRDMIQQFEEQVPKVKNMVKTARGSINSNWNLSKIRERCAGKLKVPESQYMNEKVKLLSLFERLQDKKKMFYADSNYRRKLSCTCCIVQFNSSKSKERFLRRYGRTKVGFFSQFRTWLYRKLNWQAEGETLFKGRQITLERAPEPEDIKWQNCQKKYSILRVAVIWIVTSITILISFGIMIGITYAQVKIKKGSLSIGLSAEFLNYIASFVLMIINAFLWVILPLLVKLEYNHTTSEQVISMTNKTIFAQSVNCIVLPIIVDVVMQNQLYGAQGLTEDVFDFAISNCLIQLVTLLIEPSFLFKRAALNIICLRNRLIKYLSKSETDTHPYSHKVNQFYQEPQMDIVWSYVYLTGGMLFVSFNGFLQPLILLIMCVSTILFYYIQKYLLLRRYRSPKMLDKSVFDNTLFLLNYVPIFYAGGGLVYTYYIFGLNFDIAIPCLVSLLIGIFNLRNFSGMLDRMTSWVWKKIMMKKAVYSRESTKKLTIRRRCSSSLPTRLISLIRKIKPQVEENTNTRFIKPKQIIEEQQQKFLRNMEYYQHNHISTLVAFEKQITGQLLAYDSEIRQQIKKFACKYTYKEENKYNYPDQCVSGIAMKPTNENLYPFTPECDATHQDNSSQSSQADART